MNEENLVPEEFNSREKCLQILCDLKWGNGFVCRNCGHNTAQKGKAWYYRKCELCGKDESCTSNTFFHKLKFPIETAFALIYQLSTLRKGMSCNEVSRLYNIRVSTAWRFRIRVQKSMLEINHKDFESYLRHQIKEREVGRRKDLSVELSCSSGKEVVAKISKLRSNLSEKKKRKWGKERWSGMRGKNYKPRKSKKCLEIDLKFLNTDKSDTTQIMILNMKNWIAGTHHFVSMAYLELYLAEFQYRFKRRNLPLLNCALDLLKRLVNFSKIPVQCGKGN